MDLHGWRERLPVFERAASGVILTLACISVALGTGYLVVWIIVTVFG